MSALSAEGKYFRFLRGWFEPFTSTYRLRSDCYALLYKPIIDFIGCVESFHFQARLILLTKFSKKNKLTDSDSTSGRNRFRLGPGGRNRFRLGST